MFSRPKPVVLLILDGFGYSLDKEYNAIANTPCWDKLQKDCPMTLLNCSGNVVGLPSGQMLITADHGNIEQMVDKETGQPHTAHTTNPVPLVYVGGNQPLDAGGSLSDLAPTVLAMLGVEQPVEMTGRSLIKSV
jgi:bisphosphoglycerate-independent phosphoglycerate mutase (AlkP superfamily)